ncbi:DAK2 domain-containing protein [Actinoplanes sp. M2I2]|uniref:DAK2 domain-containing protein n=1 Tax=Actinoplanes sp. M2I2 TaxID=1734444 RepID=UPI0020210B4C|nr:DAK2 domain-containing protein [Actinoplanes sp. M2I2]
MLETLDAAAVRRWCGGGLRALRAHQREIDDLNVYPVPDGDTGTNLVLTLTSAQEALDLPEPDPDPGVASPAAPEATAPASALRRMARGALLGARGNSGVIVSQILRGMADSVAASAAVRGAELATALRSASEAAYAAVARPVEGTVLTVAAAAADAAARLKSDDLVAVARAAAGAAAEALARTPQQLPALARAGVVDAGGRGLVVLLEALVEALSPPTGRVFSSAGNSDVRPQARDDDPPRGTSAGGDRSRQLDGGPAGKVSPGAGHWGYEVQYLLDAEAPRVERLRAELSVLGDSLVVVGSGDPGVAVWNVHLHVPAAAIGPAIEAGVRAGRPHAVTVTPLDDHQHEHESGRAGAAGGRAIEGPSPTGQEETAAQERAAIVVAAGDGLTALFEAEGAIVVGHNPSTGEMLEAIRASGAGSVVLLPNDANTQAVALSAAREAERQFQHHAERRSDDPAERRSGPPAGTAGLRVSVVPTRSPVQALAALAVRNPRRPFADDVIAMAEAAGACRYGEVCTARRDALTVAGPCRAGDLLGLVDGEVHVIGDDLTEVSTRLLDRMLGGGGELATLILGADAPDALDGVLRGHVARVWPFVDLHCYAGGQPRYHLLVGVE